MHDVDDYESTKLTPNADSRFQSFEDLNGALGSLGHNMKTSKKQPPASSRKIQGVIINTDAQRITLTPCPQRVRRWLSNFLTGRLFGKVGRAPLKAIFAMAHSNRSQLDKPTRLAFYALLNIIQHCKPIATTTTHYRLHSRILPSYTPTHTTWQTMSDFVQVMTCPRTRLHHSGEWLGCSNFPNGGDSWAWYFQGRLPQQILQQFSSTTAFIYLLEAWVAIIAPLICEPLLGNFHIQC
ncbi:unnamed protein product [Symbiodinium pilosum]|uniref:Uncharacterized protein n=1 Tax=Symbiodinium pilosum TaxID=2952 RepID=A0A812XDZ9_SYMPI|nr:unnamed protein product [Symbiodinium pilosum]